MIRNPSHPTDAVIQVSDLVKVYCGETHALNGIPFQVAPPSSWDSWGQTHDWNVTCCRRGCHGRLTSPSWSMDACR
jgi:hypothetical protein